MTTTYFDKYPRGWFVVAYSHEVETNAVKSLEYFGQRLVAFRDSNDTLAILDAYCPHLGADMGVGAEVKDNCLRCPFHAWKFDSTGACTDVPYAKKIPPKAKVRSWPVQERNGLIFIWHDPEQQPADYDIPIIEEYTSDHWLPWSTNELIIKTHPREVVENVADKAHFPTVHNTHVDSFENIYKDHTATQVTAGVAYPRGGGKDNFSLRATYYGPAYQVSRMDGVLQSIFFQAHTPIDFNTLELRFGVSLQASGNLSKMAGFAEQYVQNLTTGYHEDVTIWENKRYVARPVLADGDGPIAKLRKWYRQFYEPRK
jgi:3-ketosteroid 9alpha-monooxygenase subunit A